MDSINLSPCIMVVFGGTGDLTHRKILPAIYNLIRQNLLPPGFVVVAAGRRDKTDDEYRSEAYASVEKYSRFKISERLWDDMKSRLFYKKVDFTDTAAYRELDDYLSELGKKISAGGNRIFYLAVAPEHFNIIISSLKIHDMVKNTGHSWQRVVVEKPFGSSLDSAKLLNQKIAEVFDERNTYRIDHYLGKEMVRSIMGVRFSNTLFEPVWSSKYIDNVQISACETIGIERRGDYYEKMGALGDMIQNHMLQILALLAMEPPASFDAEAVRDEKLKVLSSISTFTPEAVSSDTVFGQYGPGKQGEREVSGYRQEDRVSPDSTTETFAAIKVQLDNPRWKDVPFYIRTGKRLAAKTTDAVIQFKTPVNNMSPNCDGIREPNLLVLKIQPKEELFIQFNTKKPGIQEKICPVKMNYCQKCKVCEVDANSPEAYEKLIIDVLNGDKTLFTRWDEVEKSWEIVEKIKTYKAGSNYSFPNYEPGSWGPDEAEQLLLKDGRHWWNI